MGKTIVIEVGNLRTEAELNETGTARLVWDVLPIESDANTWATRSISTFL